MADTVFNQDIILEIILNHAIQNDDKDGSLSRATICALRLVRKNWLQIISKLVQKSKKPLYKLSLNGENSVNGTRHVEEHGKLLEQFRLTVTNSNRIGKEYNPYLSIQVFENFFHHENYTDFTNFLLNSGSQLVELEMYVPLNCGSFPCIFRKSLVFPNLKKLTVHLTKKNVSRFLVLAEVNFVDSINTTQLIHAFLEGCENLIEFNVHDSDFNSLPFGFELLSLPSTITSLHLACNLMDKHLEQLAKSNFSNLTNLKLVLPPGELGEENANKIFTRFGAQLKSLEMIGLVYDHPIPYPKRISFPVMDNLQMLTVNCRCFDMLFEPNPFSSLVPNVSSVVLHHITPAVLNKLTENSTFQNVKTLCVRLVDNRNIYDNRRRYVVDINQETMQRIHHAFPNVRGFTISVSSKSRDGLEYIFREMRGLRSLKIIVTDGEDTQTCCRDYWEAVLMGTTTELVSMLRLYPFSWTEYGDEYFDAPSLKMLNELECLSLEANCSTPMPANSIFPIISLITFHFTLLQMPKLKELNMRGRFVVTALVTSVWRNEGRKLVYT